MPHNPRSSSSSALLLPLRIAIALLCACTGAWRVEARWSALDPCAAAVPSRDPTGVVQVGLLFHGPPPPDPRADRVAWGNRSPLLDAWNASSSVERRVLRGWQLFQERLEALAPQWPDGGGPALPMLDGSLMRINISYFNVGPLGVILSLDEYSDNAQNSTANALIKQLADPAGPYGRVHFLLPSMDSIAIPTLIALACEKTKSCITVGSSIPDWRIQICDDNPALIQRDCVERGRLPGSRRFDYLLSASKGIDWWGQALLELLVNRRDHNVRRIFLLREHWAPHLEAQISALARQLGMVVVGSQSVETFSGDWSSANTSVEAVTARVRAANVDQVLFISSLDTPTLFQLVAHWRDIGFSPYALTWLGGGHIYLPADLQPFILIEAGWLPTLSGANYRSFSSDIHLELFPANATHDSPAVFADAYEARFGTVSPPATGWYQQARAYHALNIVQQLLELAQTDNMDVLLDASVRIATPGVFHAVQFDQWGRTQLYHDFVLQTTPGGGERVLTPLGIGQSAILPMPTWEERHFHPRFYAQTSERIMLVVMCVAIFYLLAWFAWGVRWWQHVVLRASAPAFSAAALVGLILLLVANLCNSLHATDATCAANFFLWTASFNLAFGSLLFKNLRIWALWHNRAHDFAPARLRSPHLAAMLAALVLIDVAVNVVALLVDEGHGLKAVRVTRDPFRPSQHTMRCASTGRRAAFIAVQMSIKGLLMLSGLVLAWKLRKVSSQFSEAGHVALCVYNGTIVTAVMMTLVILGVGGPSGSVFVRNYFTLYLSLSTATIMAAPKLFAVQAAEAQRIKAEQARADALALAAAEEGGAAQSQQAEPASFQLSVLPPQENAAQRYALPPYAGPRDAAAVAAALVAGLKHPNAGPGGDGAHHPRIVGAPVPLQVPNANAARPDSPRRGVNAVPAFAAPGPVHDSDVALQMQSHDESLRAIHSSLLRATTALLESDDLPVSELERLEEALRRRGFRNRWRVAPPEHEHDPPGASPPATPSVVRAPGRQPMHPATPSVVEVSPTRLPLLAASSFPQRSDDEMQQRQLEMQQWQQQMQPMRINQ